MSEPDLYEYLRKECPDLKSAKTWIRKWFSEWEQMLPWQSEADHGYTLRAMSGHISNMLEGSDGTTGYALGGMPYYKTTYGSELYYSALGD